MIRHIKQSKGFRQVSVSNLSAFSSEEGLAVDYCSWEDALSKLQITRFPNLSNKPRRHYFSAKTSKSEKVWGFVNDKFVNSTRCWVKYRALFWWLNANKRGKRPLWACKCNLMFFPCMRESQIITWKLLRCNQQPIFSLCHCFLVIFLARLTFRLDFTFWITVWV